VAWITRRRAELAGRLWDLSQTALTGPGPSSESIRRAIGSLLRQLDQPITAWDVPARHGRPTVAKR